MARRGKDFRLRESDGVERTVVHDRRRAPPESRQSSANVSSTRSRWNSTQPQPAPAPVPAPSHSKTSPEEAVQRVQRTGELLRREVHKVIIGQEQMIEEMLICLFARGHCLTIGVPGLAKTLTVATLARALT